MVYHYKIFGNELKSHTEISWDLSRWIFGLAWVYYRKSYTIFIHFGPFSIVICQKKQI